MGRDAPLVVMVADVERVVAAPCASDFHTIISHGGTGHTEDGSMRTVHFVVIWFLSEHSVENYPGKTDDQRPAPDVQCRYDQDPPLGGEWEERVCKKTGENQRD